MVSTPSWVKLLTLLKIRIFTSSTLKPPPSATNWELLNRSFKKRLSATTPLRLRTSWRVYVYLILSLLFSFAISTSTLMNWPAIFIKTVIIHSYKWIKNLLIFFKFNRFLELHSSLLVPSQPSSCSYCLGYLDRPRMRRKINPNDFTTNRW